MKHKIKQRILAMILCIAMILTSVNLTNMFNNNINAASNSDSDYVEQDNTRLYLYKNGDECSSVTGGWSILWKNGGNAYASKDSTNLHLYSTNNTYNNWSFIGVCTNKKIDLKEYTKIVYVFDNITMATSGNGGFNFCIDSTNTADHSAGWYGYHFKEEDRGVQFDRSRAVAYIGEENTTVFNIDDITDSRYVYISLSQGTGPANDIRIKEVYLTKESTATTGSFLVINPNGGSYNGGTEEQSFYSNASTGETVKMKIDIPTRTGYTFKGWTLDSYLLTEQKGDGEGGVYVENSSGGTLLYPSGNISNAFIPNTFSIYYQFAEATKDVLTAQWVKNDYTLTINPNGGTWNNITSSQTIGGQNGTIYNNIVNPTRTGYRFKNWTLSGGGALSGTTYTFGSSNATLTANWELIKSTLTINPNGGSYKGNTSNTVLSDLAYGSEITLETPIKDGYTFTGWKLTGSDAKLLSSNKVLTGETNTTLTAQWSIIPLNITATPNNDGFGSVIVDWSTYDYADKNFKVYKSEDGINYESVGVDYTSVKEVNVLNIYPVKVNGTGGNISDKVTFYSAIDKQNYTISKAASLKMWMEKSYDTTKVLEDGSLDPLYTYGKGIIKVDIVDINTFNSNPAAYTENTKYDVIYFGTWDYNGGAGFNSNSIKYIENWIKSGKGFISGHDSMTGITNQNNSNFNSTQLNKLSSKYFNIKSGADLSTNPSGADSSGTGSDKVTIMKKGLFTNYPWYIGDVGDVLDIPTSHNNSALAYGDIWLILGTNGISQTSDGGVKNFYLTTNNNTAMIQTGHSKCEATVDEQKIIANMLFYLNQLLFNTYTTNDNSAQDYTAPNKPTITDSNNTYNFSTKDLGNDYHYYVESYDKNDTTATGLITTSNIDKVHVETGLKGYYYVADSSSTTTVTKNNSFIENSSISLSQIAGNKYLHVAAVDNAGNLSATTTIELPYTNTYTVNHYIQNLDGTYTLEETVTDTAIIGSIITPSVKEYEGFKTPSTQNIIISVDSNNIVNYYYNRNNYAVTYIDVVDNINGKVLNTNTSQSYFGDIVSGADLGDNLGDNVYHKGYYYSSATTAEVTTNGATVYRIFKLRTIDINGSVNWNDKSNAYNSRPNSITITLKLGNTEIDTITKLTSKDNDSFSFTDLQKYDTTTGEEYKYTVTQSEVLSQNAPEDKYTTTVDSTGLNFTNTLGNADFHIEGSITWVDYDNKYGTRSNEILINLYQIINGEKILYDSKTYNKDATGYSFVNLPKYDDELNSYTYVTEEVFTAKALTWNSTTKQYEEIDAYTITVNGFDFTNTLVDTKEKPIIPVKPSHINTLTIKLDFNENIDWSEIEKTSNDVNIFVALKQMETLINDGTVSYTSNYNGMEYNAVVNESGITINNIPSGKYEIIESNDNTFILEGIDLQTTNSISVVNENDKWYLIIAETNQNQSGTVILNMNTDSFNGIDDSMLLNNLYSLKNTQTAQIMMMSMFSDEVTVPEYVEPITYTITYKNCDVVDDTKYSKNSEATLKDCEIEGFLGWSEDSKAVEPQYMTSDTITLEKDLILYPVIKIPESTEDNSSEETTEEIESEEQEETTETESTLEEEIPEVDEFTEDVETETEEEIISEEEPTEKHEESSEIEETTESEEIESSAFSE